MAKEPRWETLELSTNVFGKKFTFHLCRRPVNLGPNVTVQYYWMNSADVRKGVNASKVGLQNVSSCKELWWQFVVDQRKHGRPDVLQKLLLTEIYPLFATSKGQQRIFLDAFPGGKLRTPPLGQFIPSEERVSPAKTAKQLHALLRGKSVSKNAREFAESIIGQLLSLGTMNLIENPTRGLLDFRQEIETWVAKHRRKVSLPWMPWTLDLLAYSSKIEFYETYSNAWVAIIDELERQGIDGLSIAFLNIWHFQDFNRSPNHGPPGPLGGIPLSMHPISAYLMKIPRLATVCGNFVKERAGGAWEPKQLAKRKSYRDFCQAIEYAAKQYHAWHGIQSVRESKKQAPRTQRRSGPSRSTTRNRRPECLEDAYVLNDDSPYARLTELLCARGDRCPCGGEIQIHELDSVRVRGDVATIAGQCRECHRIGEFKINAAEAQGI